MAKLIQKALEGKLRSRDARAGHLRALACMAMALITTDLQIERLAVLGIACRRRGWLGYCTDKVLSRTALKRRPMTRSRG
jgi:hypothetical protein